MLRKTILAFALVLSFLSGNYLAGSAALAETHTGLNRAGWVVHLTSYDFKAMDGKLKAAIKAEKMGLVTQASASAGAKRRGVEIPGNKIFGVYRNDFAVRMLEASLAAGIEAPVRFYLSENADGGSTLAYKPPSLVFAPYFFGAGEDLKVLASELDVIFARIAAQAIAN